ncbi:hypothetical protein ZIOFF_056094 [Zingiber officinale]|uniref:Acyl-CoA-binding domain-containing protein 4 n=1 Tax=Zingiber officinale TaxID=94328 RepID=A0A8J5FN98_ZINOF|nr:hypothetical protein ZIOFF_056094 [Zingiber officinale]
MNTLFAQSKIMCDLLLKRLFCLVVLFMLFLTDKIPNLEEVQLLSNLLGTIVQEENVVVASSSGRSDGLDCRYSSRTFDTHNFSVGSTEEWRALPTYGNKPTPRSHHAAVVIGSKMVVVGGDSGHGLLDDTLVLNLETLTWMTTVSSVYSSSGGVALKFPACKGHSLVSCGKSALLVGGRTDPPSDKLSVWSFNVEVESWSLVEAKGNIPVARSGHTVHRAGNVLILFGGEDMKGRKLNDLYMFDLKSLSWLPLHYKGAGPSARSNHVAALYEDKLLFVYGGQSKSKILRDFYSLDFETMIWSRVKVHGHHPSPRAGCCGALCGTKWYIIGGGSKRRRHAEILIFDILKFEWSTSVMSPSVSVITNRGFSLLPVNHKDKVFLLAFGGHKKEPSSQVEILFLATNEHSMSSRSAPDTELLPYEEQHAVTIKDVGAHLKTGSSPTSVNHATRHSLASALEQQISGRKSISDDPSPSAGMPISKQFHQDQDYCLANKMQKPSLEDENYETDDQVQNNRFSQSSKRQESEIKMDIAGILASTEEMLLVESEGSNVHLKQGTNSLSLANDRVLSLETDGRSVLTNPSNIYHQLYESKIASLTRKNAVVEEQLKAALTGQESTEKSLASAARSTQEMEIKLADAHKEIESLKEKLAAVELAQEEANSLSNIVHSDNELHSTRGVLAGERARAFQLQVEVFHLKQRLQSLDSRAPTPKKPFPM